MRERTRGDGDGGTREREEIRSSDGRGPPAPRCEVAGGAGEPGGAGTVVHVSLCLYVRVIKWGKKRCGASRLVGCTSFIAWPVAHT